MKIKSRNLIVFLLVYSCLLPLYSSGQWLDLTSQRYAIDYSADGSIGFMAGKNLLMKSTDGGNTWSNVPQPMEEFIAIALKVSADAKRIQLYVNNYFNFTTQTSGAALLLSEDGGATWRVPFMVAGHTAKPFFQNELNVWLTTDPGHYGPHKCWRTTDGGITWTESTPLVNATTIAFRGDEGWAFVFGSKQVYGVPSKLLRSHDGGNTWFLSNDQLDQSVAVTTLIVFDDLTAMGISEDGATYPSWRTTDGGVTWSPYYPFVPGIPSGPMRWRWSPYQVMDDHTAWMVRGGNLYLTTDAGATWSVSKAWKTYQTIQNVKFVTASTGYIIGDGGYLASTHDGGSTWTTHNHTPYGRLLDAHIKDNTLYAVIDDQDGDRLLKGNLETASWDTVKNITLVKPFDINFWDDTAVVGGGTFVMSDDNGATWADKPKTWINEDLFGSHLVQMFPRGGNTIWAATGDGRIWKSTDGGGNFVIKQPRTTGGTHRMIFQSEMKIWAISRGGPGGLYSSNGGESWSMISESITGMFFLDDFIGWKYNVTGGNNLLKTIDGGNTWVRIGELPLVFYSDIFLHFADELNGWAFRPGTYSENFYKTKDGGKSWECIGTYVSYELENIQMETTATGQVQAAACGFSGMLMYRDAFTPVPVVTLELPTNLATSNASYQSITLSWQDQNTQEDGFYVQRKGPSGDFVTIATLPANATDFTDPSPLPAPEAYYRVGAFIDDRLIVYSGLVKVNYTPPPAVPPLAPGNLQVTARSPASIKLTWTDPEANETGYAIDRKTGTAAFSTIKTLPANTVMFIDTFLLPLTEYTYRVKTIRSNEQSPYSFQASATTFTPPPPASPSDLVITISNGVGLALSWKDNASTETGFRITRSADNDDEQELAVLPANVSKYIDSSVAPAVTYTYRVGAFHAFGNSGFITAEGTIPLTVTSIDPEGDNLPSVYPNPMTDKITVRWPFTLFNLKITDARGLKIREQVSITGLLDLELTGVPAGVYFVTLQSGKIQVIRKMVKM